MILQQRARRRWFDVTRFAIKVQLVRNACVWSWTRKERGQTDSPALDTLACTAETTPLRTFLACFPHVCARVFNVYGLFVTSLSTTGANFT